MDAVDTSEDGRRQLGTEGVPHAVFDLRRRAVLARGGLHRYQLLAVYRLRDCQWSRRKGEEVTPCETNGEGCKQTPTMTNTAKHTKAQIWRNRTKMQSMST